MPKSQINLVKPKKSISKGQIERLGDKIRSEGKSIQEETLVQLQEYRTSHKETLSKVFNVICSTCRGVTGESIVIYRIKRFESIIGKLERYPDMSLSRMWDIGGCRCILKNNAQVYQLKTLIEANLTVRKVKDYIQFPQEEGYKSLHLFVTVPDDDKVIEIQLRNQEDHNWATLVEITDLLFDAKLKELGLNKELLRFHFLLSKIPTLTLLEKKEIADTIAKYSYFDRLSEVFGRNYLNVRRQWMAIETKPNHKYFLIETRKDQIPKIESFEKFNEAEDNYFQVYKTTQNTNIVLTHLPSPTYKKISTAYSNYILTVHAFLDDIYKIIEGLIIESLSTGRYLDFIKYFKLYNHIVVTHVRNMVAEMMSVREYSSKTSRKSKLNARKKEKEWTIDIRKQVSNRTNNAKQLQQAFAKSWPKSRYRKWVVNTIIKIIIYLSNRRLTRLLGSLAEFERYW